MIKHPDVTIQLSGEDGNVYSIIGRVQKALRREGYRDTAESFIKEAMECESYEKVLQLVMRTVTTH